MPSVVLERRKPGGQESAPCGRGVADASRRLDRIAPLWEGPPWRTTPRPTKSSASSISDAPTTCDAGEAAPEPLLYDSRDLVTHAVCVGMTGSGKTGLLISLLEEAAIDSIPALVIDPKGDLANLLLTFPELRPADFAPWIDPDAAARAGLTPEAFAAKEAETWRNGLAQWGQSGERIARLREAADFAIYTPGSEAGLPVSILSSLAAPPPEMRERRRPAARAGPDPGVEPPVAPGDRLRSDARARAHPASPTSSTRPGAQGKGARSGGAHPADPEAAGGPHRRARPGVLLSRQGALRAGHGGATACSARPASAPGSRASRSTSTACSTRPSGKPRVAIFSIAHLSDRERMFFVSLLLNQTLGWMRSRPGTTQPAGDPLHGRGLRLHAAGGGAAVEAAAADAAQAGARLRPRPRARHPEPGGPRLQGALATSAPGSSAACRPSATSSASWTAWKGRRPAATFDRGRMEQMLCRARQPGLPAAQRARGRAGGVPDAAGPCPICAARSPGPRSSG